MDDKNQSSQTTSPAAKAATAAPPAAQSPAAAPPAAKPIARVPKVGDRVWLHTPPGKRCGGRPLPATIKAVVKPTVVSLKTDEDSEHAHEIKHSQFDPTGEKADCWSFRD